MAASERATPIRELILAFSAAAKAALTESGWRKHNGDVFTLDFNDGTLAWLGLNRAAKHRPLRIHPVAGVRHEATMRLCDDLGGGNRYVAATLSERLAYLEAERAADLAIDALSDVPPAVAHLLNLVDTRAMPFAESYRNPERQLAALRLRKHLPVPESAIIRRPAMLAVLGRTQEAIDDLNLELTTLGNRDDAAAKHYRRLGDALRDWIVANA